MRKKGLSMDWNRCGQKIECNRKLVIQYKIYFSKVC